MPQVTEIGGELSLHDVGALTAIALGSLELVGRVIISEAPLLTALTLPALTTAGTPGADPSLSGILLANTGITAIDWPLLQVVSGDLVLNSSPALQSVRLPRLVTATALVLISTRSSRPYRAEPRGRRPRWISSSRAPVQTLDLERSPRRGPSRSTRRGSRI